MTKKQTSSAEFAAYNQEKKLELLRKDGVYIGKIKDGDQLKLLFQLYTFYVEIHYADYRKRISEMVVSESMDLLQPYLQQINIRNFGREEDENK